MKTGKKIAIVFIVLVIVLSVFYYVRTRGEAGVELPVYPGGSKVNIPQIYMLLVPEGIAVEAYDVAAPLESVAAWYEGEMSALGWSKENKLIQEGVIMIGWKKNSDGAGIMVTTKEAQLIKEYADLFDDNILQLYRGSWDKIHALLFPQWY
jgi:hypothetical protein